MNFTPSKNFYRHDMLAAKASSKKEYERNSVSSFESREESWYVDNIDIRYTSEFGFHMYSKKHMSKNTILGVYGGRLLTKEHFFLYTYYLVEIGVFSKKVNDVSGEDSEEISPSSLEQCIPSPPVRAGVSSFRLFSACQYNACANSRYSAGTVPSEEALSL